MRMVSHIVPSWRTCLSHIVPVITYRMYLSQVTAFKESLMWVDGAADESLGGPRWKLFMFSPSIG